MSTIRKPHSSPLKRARKLTAEELDKVAGGTGATAGSQQLNQIAGFDTSHLHLDAASMQSGETEKEVAAAVGGGHTDDAHALHLLEAVAATDHTSVTQALAVFGADMASKAGHHGDGLVVGIEIGHLIANGTVSPMQALHDIGAAVGH